MVRVLSKTQFYCATSAAIHCEKREACFFSTHSYFPLRLSFSFARYALFRLSLYTRVLSLNRKKGIFISSLLMAMRCKHGRILVCFPFFYLYDFESPRQITVTNGPPGVRSVCSVLPYICKSPYFPRFCECYPSRIILMLHPFFFASEWPMNLQDKFECA